MKIKSIMLFLFTLSSLNLFAADVILLVGASCSGKSSVARTICRALNSPSENWKVVDFDEVGENLDNLKSEVNKLLSDGKNVIIDTNTYKESMEQDYKPASKILKVSVYAELEVLLQRDELRTKKMHRECTKAKWARKFVKESYRVYKIFKHDIEVNTNDNNQDQCANIILNYYKK